MRKLASIQRITKLESIEGADRIEVATVLGWRVIVGKGDFEVGSLVIYIEIDSILSDRPEFAQAKARSSRVKTIRMKGEVSQGIIYPLSIIGDAYHAAGLLVDMIKPKEDDDVTELLGITKYEPEIPAQLAGKIKGRFPDFLIKTDETRVQILSRVLDTFNGTDELFQAREKLDGSSITVFMKDGEFGVCSRNLQLEETEDNSFWKAARQCHIEDKMHLIGLDNFCLQGELIGPGIQKNKYNLTEHRIYFFNAYDIKTGKYLDDEELEKLLLKMDLNIAPVAYPPFKLNHTVRELVAMAEGKSILNKKTEREGIVIRPLKEQNFRHNDLHHDRLSFKVISEKFLLKNEDA